MADSAASLATATRILAVDGTPADLPYPDCPHQGCRGIWRELPRHDKRRRWRPECDKRGCPLAAGCDG